MESLKIVPLGDKLLRQKTALVKSFGRDLDRTAKEMIRIMDGYKGVGLAAPQVGILQSFFVVHAPGDYARLFVNPSLLETSGETSTYEEGCLSIRKVYANIVRSSSIKIHACNADGAPFTINCTGMLARIIQHEIDHLQGVLFLDHVEEGKRERLIKKYEKINKTKGILEVYGG